jgi:hypothetical protein
MDPWRQEKSTSNSKKKRMGPSQSILLMPLRLGESGLPKEVHLATRTLDLMWSKRRSKVTS